MYTANIQKLQRHFVPADFIVTDWQGLEPFFKTLLEKEITSKEQLEHWLMQMSELELVRALQSDRDGGQEERY